MLKNYYVYIHTFKNGTKYIGKGRDNRAFVFTNRNVYWNNVSSKHGSPSVCIIKSNLLEREALDLEVMIIEIMKTANIHICNITNGGEGSSGLTGEKSFWFGKSRSKDTCHKISKSLSRENHPNFGISLSQITKDKIGDKHRGKKVSEETRKLLVKRGKERELNGSNNPAYSSEKHKFIHLDFGVVVATQYELCTTYRLTKSAICCVASGKRPSHKGWRLA